MWQHNQDAHRWYASKYSVLGWQVVVGRAVVQRLSVWSLRMGMRHLFPMLVVVNAESGTRVGVTLAASA